MALTRQDLWSLEEYAERRPEFRIQAMQHKKIRQLALGSNARLFFEDETTVRYQVQEMLRIERVFEAAGIQDELDAYNPLIPDGSNWKATFMLQFEDPEIRALKTRELRGIDKHVWLQVADFEKVYPIANEDLERDDGEKTSTVHFFRFEFSPAMVASMQSGAAVYAGIDHPAYQVESEALPRSLLDALVLDFGHLARA